MHMHTHECMHMLLGLRRVLRVIIKIFSYILALAVRRSTKRSGMTEFSYECVSTLVCVQAKMKTPKAVNTRFLYFFLPLR